MKLEALLWTGVTVYFFVIGGIYFAAGGEEAGLAILAMAVALGGLVAGWSWHWRRRHGDRVEDRAESDAADAAGVVGVFPAASLRPLALAVGISAAFLGVALGSWMTLAGLGIVASQVALLVRDADR